MSLSNEQQLSQFLKCKSVCNIIITELISKVIDTINTIIDIDQDIKHTYKATYELDQLEKYKTKLEITKKEIIHNKIPMAAYYDVIDEIQNIETNVDNLYQNVKKHDIVVNKITYV